MYIPIGQLRLLPQIIEYLNSHAHLMQQATLSKIYLKFNLLAGFTVGNFAKFNGNPISILPNDGCGLNVVEFDEERNVIHKQSFDTFLNSQQSR